VSVQALGTGYHDRVRNTTIITRICKEQCNDVKMGDEGIKVERESQN